MKYFGTDGIRGIPNELLNISFLNKLGKSLVFLNSKEIVIASDTRVSKDMISLAIASGAISMGLHVRLLGVLPTPAIIHYSYLNKVVGVMVTASHNPYNENGIKILNKGFKLNEVEELEIEKLIESELESNNIGTLKIDFSSRTDYIDFLIKNVVKTNLKISIDCANGATITTAPYIFSKVTNNLIVIGNEANGFNINKDCGSTNISNLINNVISNKCDIGFAFDGDGDRVICVDNAGNVIDGDMIIYLIAIYLKKNNKLKNNGVALSIMSNLGLINKLKENGIDIYETPVGDKYIYQMLDKYNLSIGGENSGHIIIRDLLNSGDGVLVALQVIKILEETKTCLSDWFKDLHMYCCENVNIKVRNKKNIINDIKILDMIEKIKFDFNYDCKIIVRPSGTEDLLRVLIMAKDKDVIKYKMESLINLIKECDNNE